MQIFVQKMFWKNKKSFQK